MKKLPTLASCSSIALDVVRQGSTSGTSAGWKPDVGTDNVDDSPDGNSHAQRAPRAHVGHRLTSVGVVAAGWWLLLKSKRSARCRVGRARSGGLRSPQPPAGRRALPRETVCHTVSPFARAHPPGRVSVLMAVLTTGSDGLGRVWTCGRSWHWSKDMWGRAWTVLILLRIRRCGEAKGLFC